MITTVIHFAQLAIHLYFLEWVLSSEEGFGLLIFWN